MTLADRRAVALWLLLVAALVFCLAVLGGVVRLTGSGLAITDWRPFTGWLPPLDEAGWQERFALYRASPEYRQVHAGMELAGFKALFLLEYAHRLLARAVGLAYALPFAFFLLRRRLSRGLALRLAALFALGALQGVAGWFMVASGLAEEAAVSPYRLALHLALALAIYGALLWIALGLLPVGSGVAPAPPWAVRQARWLPLPVAAAALSGAFVAGLDAGLYYNTFPLMAGRLVPADWAGGLPWWRAPFESVAAAQFHHRLLAVATVAAILVWRLAAWRAGPSLPRHLARLATALAATALLQAGLGIATLLAYVPVWLGALHQAGALALFTLAVALAAVCRRARQA